MFRLLRNRITIDELLRIHQIGLIGTIEARSWLAYNYRGFKKSRRQDVDDMIEDFASQIINQPSSDPNDPFVLQDDEDEDDL